jgi:methionyl-tRNA formyltransferase
MRVIFFGTPQFAVPTLNALLQSEGRSLLGVVTQPDKRRGRGKQMIPSPVKEVALAENLPIWQPARLRKDVETIAALKAAEADVFVVVAYGQILSPEILAIPKFGCINVHGSLLPQYRGAAPMQWALYNGDRQTGITTMLMDEGMDTGASLLKISTPIQLLDNIQSLGARLAQDGANLLLATLSQLEQGTITPIPQDSQAATYAPLLKKSDFSLDWQRSAIAIHNQVRGFYANGWTTFREQTLKVLATIPLGEDYWSQLPAAFQELVKHWPDLQGLTGQPGEVVAILKNWGPVVRTGDGLLLLTEVQLAGKRVQSGGDWVNGTHLQRGEVLGSTTPNIDYRVPQGDHL